MQERLNHIQQLSQELIEIKLKRKEAQLSHQSLPSIPQSLIQKVQTAIAATGASPLPRYYSFSYWLVNYSMPPIWKRKY